MHTARIPIFQMRTLRPRFLRPCTEPELEFRLPDSRIQHLTSSLIPSCDNSPRTWSPPALPSPLRRASPTPLQCRGSGIQKHLKRTGKERSNLNLPRWGGKGITTEFLQHHSKGEVVPPKCTGAGGLSPGAPLCPHPSTSFPGSLESPPALPHP